VAVDTSILLYKYRHASTKSHSDLHITGFINRVVFYLQAKTIPIFIFDGKPPEEKADTLAERRDAREKAEEQIRVLESQVAGDDLTDESRKEITDKLENAKNNLVYVKREHFQDVRNILSLLGIPYFDPSEYGLGGEAEHICSTIQKRGIVDHVVTDDTDTFVFGATSVLRSSSGGKVQHIFLNNILQGLDMTYNEFVDFCIISGCDYCNTIPRVACAGAYSAIKKYKNIETWLKTLPESTQETDAYRLFVKQYGKARQIFLQDYMDIPPDALTGPPEMGEFKEENFISFLTNRGWETTNVSKVVKKIKAARNKIGDISRK
tara:strand:+ start:223 stop:1185 length:963 start_codon:yes stop_codon:yes gene_type:complete